MITTQPPQTSPPGGAPIPKKPLHKRAWFWIIAGLVVIVIIAAAAGSSGRGGKPQSSGGGTSTQTTQTSPAQQLRAWYKASGKADLTAMSNATDAVSNDEQKISKDMKAGTGYSADVSRLKADATRLQNAIRIAQADLPPVNYNGFRTEYSYGLSYGATDATDTLSAVQEIDSGDFAAAITDLENSISATDQATSALNKAAADLGS